MPEEDEKMVPESEIDEVIRRQRVSMLVMVGIVQESVGIVAKGLGELTEHLGKLSEQLSEWEQTLKRVTKTDG